MKGFKVHSGLGRISALMAANYFVMVIGLFTGYMISTELGANFYGLYGKVKAVYASYSVIASGTITTAVLVAGGNSQLRKLYELATIQLSFAFLAIVLFSFLGPNELTHDTIFYSFSLLCVSASTYFTGTLILRGLYLSQAISLVSGSLVAFGIMFFCDIGSEKFYLLIGLPSVVTISGQVIFSSISGVKYRLFMPRWSTIKWLFKLIFPIILAAWIVAQSIAKIYTEINSGLEYLELSRTLLNGMLVLPQVWLQSVLPKMGVYRNYRFKNIPIIYFYVGISILFASIIYAMSPIVFKFYCIDFHSKDNIIWQFMLAFPLSSMALYYANLILLDKSTNHLLIANMLFSLGLLALNYLLKFNIHYVGLTFVLGYALQNFYLMLRVK